MLKVLFLDDDQNRHDAFRPHCAHVELHAVYTAKEAIQKLGEHNFDVAFLDHDLGGDSFVPSERGDTGYQVAQYMSRQQPPVVRLCVVHSLNPAGSANIHGLLKQAGYSVVQCPFTMLLGVVGDFLLLPSTDADTLPC